MTQRTIRNEGKLTGGWGRKSHGGPQDGFPKQRDNVFKGKILPPFLSKQSNCLQFLIDFFSQLPHIKTLHGVLAIACGKLRGYNGARDNRINSNQSMFMT